MRPLSIVILIFSSLIFLINVYRFQNLFLDDAYISYRFAQRLAEAKGLTWNEGGEPVEGFTSLLHIFLVASAIKAGIRPHLASLGIAVTSVLATVVLLVIMLRRQFSFIYPLTAVTLGIYLIDDVTALNATNGLETQLFVFLLCLGYVVALAFLDSPNLKTGLWLGFAVFVSVLGRPEGILYGLALYSVLGAY